MSRHSYCLSRRLSGKLHFFPALLPLVEIIPLVLTALGALAGGVGFASRKLRKVLVLSLLCFAVAGGIVIAAMPDKEVRDDGSRAVLAENLPITTTVKAYQKQAAVTALPRFTDLWTVKTKHQLLSSPVVSHGVLVIGTYKDTVEAYALHNGDLLWHFQQDEPMFTVGKGPGNIVFAGEGLHHTQSAALTALTVPEGKVQWQREFLGHIESAPQVSADEKTIYLPTGPGGIWAVRVADGRVVWHQAIGHIDSTPMIDGNTIYAAAQPDEAKQESLFYALRADTGKVKWQTPLPGMPWGRAALSVDGKRLLTSTGLGQIGVQKDTDRGWAMALDPKNGKLLWQRDLENMPVEPGSYLPESDIMIHTLKSGKIIAVQGHDGSTAWEADIGSKFMASGTLIRRTGKSTLLAATTADGTFTIRDAATGAELARRLVLKGGSSAPVVEGDRIYVATPYRLYAFGGIGSL